ncbi:MAG TPA: hypothetical protein VD887_03845 [Allosphingosinicella sp.]|nr:hypothetical protein [Allosphingosinicella sp.]
MLGLAAILAVATAEAPMTPPSQPLARRLYGAIWDDLQLNAMIGNGNRIAALWYQAGADGTTHPLLHILDLRCRGRGTRRVCHFTLFREGGGATYLGEPAPDRLACTARFRRSRTIWGIEHIPPTRGGHSQTAMRCEGAAAPVARGGATPCLRGLLQTPASRPSPDR